MRLLKKLFQIISRNVPIATLSEEQVASLSRLNPEKFYVENVRSILGISSQTASLICEAAVRQGVFSKGIEVRCPDGAVAATAENENKLPEKVRCWNPEDGFLEQKMLSTVSLEKVTFYRLNDETDSIPIGQTA